MRLRILAAALLALTGCASPYVETTISNRCGAPISELQVDYPSASFGATALADGADFHYRFKIQGSGTLKLSYTDAAHQDHLIPGPALLEGQRGTLRITIDAPGHALFAPALTPAN
jgi:hypothetical protein